MINTPFDSHVVILLIVAGIFMQLMYLNNTTDCEYIHHWQDSTTCYTIPARIQFLSLTHVDNAGNPTKVKRSSALWGLLKVWGSSTPQFVEPEVDSEEMLLVLQQHAKQALRENYDLKILLENSMQGPDVKSVKVETEKLSDDKKENRIQELEAMLSVKEKEIANTSSANQTLQNQLNTFISQKEMMIIHHEIEMGSQSAMISKLEKEVEEFKEQLKQLQQQEERLNHSIAALSNQLAQQKAQTEGNSDAEQTTEMLKRTQDLAGKLEQSKVREPLLLGSLYNPDL